ncbi:hypothetical protein ACIBBD_32765 [Streptomyces sp. NPDC051315]|uniref:hypothetical protein n=1 Tax=Streptomyces sp. NPDC051315 TaxID=3365650 RepID=UPI0037B107CB
MNFRRVGQSAALPCLATHTKVYAESGAAGRAFAGEKQAAPRRHHFDRLWHKAVPTPE